MSIFRIRWNVAYSLILWGGLAFSGTAVAQVDFLDRLDPRRDLNFIERQVQKQARARNHELTVGETWLVSRHPFYAFTVLELSLDAHLYSSELCELPNARRAMNSRGRNMAETDAVRHFIASTLLTLEMGAALAERFLVAHEILDTTWPASSQMDVYNNSLGIEFGIALKEDSDTKSLSEPELLDTILAEALSRLEHGELSVVRAESKGSCGRTRLYPNTLHLQIPESYLGYQWLFQD